MNFLANNTVYIDQWATEHFSHRGPLKLLVFSWRRSLWPKHLFIDLCLLRDLLKAFAPISSYTMWQWASTMLLWFMYECATKLPLFLNVAHCKMFLYYVCIEATNFPSPSLQESAAHHALQCRHNAVGSFSVLPCASFVLSLLNLFIRSIEHLLLPPATSSWRGLPTIKQPPAVPGRKKSATVHQHIGWQHTRRYGGAVQSNAVHLLSWFWVECDGQRLLCPLHHHWWWWLVRWYCCDDRTVSCSGVAGSLSSSPVAY